MVSIEILMNGMKMAHRTTNSLLLIIFMCEASVIHNSTHQANKIRKLHNDLILLTHQDNA